METTETIATVRAFLALPDTDLPSATLLDDADGDAWALLRALAGEDDSAAAYTGERIRLHATSAPWNQGVTIVVNG